MELNYFKDILFDLINEGAPGVLEIISNDKENWFMIVMKDGSVFRLQCSKESFNLFRPPE